MSTWLWIARLPRAGPAASLLPPPLRLPGPMRGSNQPWMLSHKAAFSDATEALRKLVNTGAGAAAESAGAAPLAMPFTPTPSRVRLAKFLQIFLPISGVTLLAYAFTHPDAEPLVPTRMPPQLQYLAAQQSPNEEVLVNWSGTHEAKPRRLFSPQSEVEVEAFLRAAHEAGQKLRPVGSALSPNGLALSDEGLLSMGLLDKVLNVDLEKKQVTVQAGCRVQQLADALKPYGLSLQNYASIREQQVGGFIQVSAHGTGARIPPVDDQVLSLKLATPAFGLVSLSPSDEPELFSLAKVGLGALGVVTQATLQCVPRHQLLETTFTTTFADVKKNHAKWLKENQHLKYLFIPYTDTVVVVSCNPVKGDQAQAPKPSTFTQEQQVQPLTDLYLSRQPSPSSPPPTAALDLRSALLALDPLSPSWVQRINQAEAEAWKRSSGQRLGYSDEVLSFDCGGQQWVLETVFKVAESVEGVKRGGSKDMEYMEALLGEIKRSGIPAPGPIEVRWSSGSSSLMSPAAGTPSSVHCWVGVIMYLPDEAEAREAVTQAFRGYAGMVQDKLMPRFDAVWHWAKLEPGQVSEAALQRRLSTHYPVQAFNKYRMLLDPKNILGNAWLDKVFPLKQA